MHETWWSDVAAIDRCPIPPLLRLATSIRLECAAFSRHPTFWSNCLYLKHHASTPGGPDSSLSRQELVGRCRSLLSHLTAFRSSKVRSPSTTSANLSLVKPSLRVLASMLDTSTMRPPVLPTASSIILLLYIATHGRCFENSHGLFDV